MPSQNLEDIAGLIDSERSPGGCVGGHDVRKQRHPPDVSGADPDVPNPPKSDPVLVHARREAIIIGLTWLAATIYCCVSSYLLGYDHPGHKLGKNDVKPILGVPSWAFWSYLVPWAVCAVFTFWFAGFYMADDDLGRDHNDELEGDIREGGLDE
jgi:hypothetical protein